MKSHNHKANVYDYFYVGEDSAKDQGLIQFGFQHPLVVLVASTRLQSF